MTEAAIYYASRMVTICSIYKHRAFREEDEARLIVAHVSGISPTKAIRIRDGKLGKTPYIEIPLDFRSQESSLEQIIVGPSSNQAQNIALLKIKLQEINMGHVNVLPSQIPYRNW